MAEVLLKVDASQGDLLDARLARLRDIMGREFAENALALDKEREGLRLTGFAALPTFNRGTSAEQYLFVNDRPVRDKLLLGAVKGAYQDVLAHDRHPVVALFLELPPEEVDVNVHPAKAEVRFRDSNAIRGLMIGAIKHALGEAGFRASTSVGVQTLQSFFQPSASESTSQLCLSARPAAAIACAKPSQRFFEPLGAMTSLLTQDMLPPLARPAEAHSGQCAGLYALSAGRGALSVA